MTRDQLIEKLKGAVKNPLIFDTANNIAVEYEGNIFKLQEKSNEEVPLDNFVSLRDVIGFHESILSDWDERYFKRIEGGNVLIPSTMMPLEAAKIYEEYRKQFTLPEPIHIIETIESTPDWESETSRLSTDLDDYNLCELELLASAGKYVSTFTIFTPFASREQIADTFTLSELAESFHSANEFREKFIKEGEVKL